MQPMKPMEPMKPMQGSAPWWPESLGTPSSTGGQDSLRYAFFPDTHRLAIEQDGKITVYDSGEHRITGISQHGAAPVFSGEDGTVRVEDLRRVD